MRFDRFLPLASIAAFLFVFALGMANAHAGNITYTKSEIQESNGGWHLVMTVDYGGKPNTAHVPMRFTFTSTAILENYLDDAHGDKPQKRKIPLIGQVPINESVDVDFSDPRGKLFSKTRFDFTITRDHGFSAGDYTVIVHRADGAAVGASHSLVLLGDNPVIDRRAITFVGNIKKDKPAANTAAASAPTAAAGAESAPAAGGAAEGTPAPEATPEPAPAT
ncbi:MAG TPA: hypothetical protein VGL13_13595, partial [Polyangiaceae bacterium]